MDASRRYLVMFAIVFACGLPATAAYLHYRVTKNPLLQPLGITREKLAEVNGPTQFVSIFVHVDWGRERREGMSRSAFRQLVTRAFSTRTDDLVFKFREVPGDRVGVTFVVGPNRFGPYPPDRMVDGIVPATVALAMTKEHRARMQAQSGTSR